jgi:hypothetical protein
MQQRGKVMLLTVHRLFLLTGFIGLLLLAFGQSAFVYGGVPPPGCNPQVWYR